MKHLICPVRSKSCSKKVPSKLFFSPNTPQTMEMSFWRGIQGRADEQEAASYARLRRDAFEVSVTTEDSSSRGSRQGEGKVSGLALPPCCEGDFTLWAMRCHSASPRRSLGPRRELDVRLIREAPATLTRSTRPAAAAQMLTGDVADTDGAAAVGFSRGKVREKLLVFLCMILLG